MSISLSTPIVYETQLHFQPPLPDVKGCKEYDDYKSQLERIDHFLDQSRTEARFLEESVKDLISKTQKDGREPKLSQIGRYRQQSRLALRGNIARILVGESLRGFTARLAESALLQRFCGLAEIEGVQVPGKSTVQRWNQWLPEERMNELTRDLLKQCSGGEWTEALGDELDLQVIFMDTTCLKADIHFPVDWVLLRDGVRTLMNAVMRIREHGLKHRMEDPEKFLSQINKMCMEMTQNRGGEDGKKARKKVVRRMKVLVGRVEEHAQRYRDLLEEKWETTDLSQGRAQQFIDRIDDILDQMPAAKKQAHERIIAERKVPNEEKILSLYESEIEVMVRGKAGAKVEFGNKLFLGENPQGLILDWLLFDKGSPSDSKLVRESVERTENSYGVELVAASGDRGFSSKANQNYLEEKEIFDGICPKNPRELKERLEEDEVLGDCLKRRAQTEGRIGIFKNCFTGNPMKVKGLPGKKRAVTWSVLTHNLWVLARMSLTAEKRKKQEQTQQEELLQKLAA